MHIVINIKHYCGLCENARNRFLVIIYLYFNFSESNFRGIQYPMNVNEIDVLILQIMYLLQTNDKNDIVNFHDGGRYHIDTSPLICRANQ